MYRAYIRNFKQQVMEKTNTPDQAVARAAFEALVNRSELDGQKLAAALTFNSRQLAFHRFDRMPGDADYWRDKLNEIEWPSPGGVRPGAGRKARDGAVTERAEVRIDAETRAHFIALGGGELSPDALSLGAREASRRLRGLPPQDWTRPEN